MGQYRPNNVATEKQLACRWKPGQSGNPKGKPKQPSTTEIIRKVLGQKAPKPDGKPDKTYRELLVRKLLGMALNGNLKAAEIILDRDDPKSLNIRSEEIVQIQVMMGVAAPPEGWEPRRLAFGGNGRCLPPPGDNGR